MESFSVLPEDPKEAEEPGAVSIELNFKAFADNVPTSRHAKRAKGPNDPSVQDFADQVLELATLRAELKRLEHDYQVLQHQAAVRESRLDALHLELMATRKQLLDARRQPSEDALEQETTVTLEPPPAIPHLVPLDQPDLPKALSGDIVTIGRTRNSDICIESRGVSRDHARLLIAPGRVTLVDVSTTNGCFVNGALVKRHRLRDGDIVRIGDRSFRFAQSLGPVGVSVGSRKDPQPVSRLAHDVTHHMTRGEAHDTAHGVTQSLAHGDTHSPAGNSTTIAPGSDQAATPDDRAQEEQPATSTATTTNGVYWNLG